MYLIFSYFHLKFSNYIEINLIILPPLAVTNCRVGYSGYSPTAALADADFTTVDCDANGDTCQYKMLKHRDGRQQYVGQCNSKEACLSNASYNAFTCKMWGHSGRRFIAQCWSCCEGPACDGYAPSLIEDTNQPTDFSSTKITT